MYAVIWVCCIQEIPFNLCHAYVKSLLVVT